MNFLKRHNIALQLLLLLLALSTLAFYNYDSQQRVLLRQLEEDSSDLLQSVRASINRFQQVRGTLSINRLVSNISLGLDIFEFRYLDRNGITVSSMFAEEVGKRLERPGIERALNDPAYLDRFYVEERDFTPVLAVSHPVRRNGELVGIIDLAVDIGTLDYLAPATREATLRRMETDIANLLQAIGGSIKNSLAIFATVERNEFLRQLVDDTGGLIGIDIGEVDGAIEASDRPERLGMPLRERLSDGRFVVEEGRTLYRLVAQLGGESGRTKLLLLSIDADDYIANGEKLFFTALATTLLTLLAALTITYTIYRINLQRTQEANLRLERLVEERTAELKRISRTDKLTGLANRCALEEHLDLEYKRATRYQHELSLIVVDLDHFKRVNDTWGHLAGDEVLKVIAGRLQGKLRDTDFIGRFGGEEFVVLLPETGLCQALPVAEELRRLVAAEPVPFEGEGLAVTASLGVAALSDHHIDHQGIFTEADEALYHSKESGRNRVTYFDDEAPHEYRGA